MAGAVVLFPSRALLKQALLVEVDRCFEADHVGCFETVKANEHVELFEYASRRTPFRKRLKTTIFALSDRPDAPTLDWPMSEREVISVLEALDPAARAGVLRYAAAQWMPAPKGRR